MLGSSALLAKPSGLEAEAAEKKHGADLSARRSVLAHGAHARPSAFGLFLPCAVHAATRLMRWTAPHEASRCRGPSQDVNSEQSPYRATDLGEVTY